MRIIAGKRKGLLLQAPKGYDTRPTIDRVKEAMFNVIQGYEQDAHVLDLFAGTGALGLEALSRGARLAVFVEKHPPAWRVLSANIAKAGFQDQAVVIKGDALVFLRQYEGMPFDLIFIDPPYGSDLVVQVLTSICRRGLLAPGGLVVLETGVKYGPVPAVPGLQLLKEKIYGDTMLLFFEPAKEEEGHGRI
ncbi:MAG TPA: 16S rRNA (guanine(966)-N(2))-methyltransferase RsmD [Clostridia bacterium]|nr:16S rRNA (guanine(966)-N(2))-methyltransferase RsmD [Clostridia bacterium]